MSNVLIDRQKIDILANAISGKSGVPVTMTLDEMVEAVDGIETEPNLQAKTYTVDSAGTETITADGGYDGLSEVEVTVPLAELRENATYHFGTKNGQRKWNVQHYLAVDNDGFADASMYYTQTDTFDAIPTGTTVTPTESAQTIGGTNYMMEGAVTVNAISSNYVGSDITRCTASDVVFVEDGEYYAVVGEGYYANNVWKEVPSGTAGTPTAIKGTVSNYQVSVTPSVTNTAGYISGGTKTGTAVTVSASELVSGTLSITSSGTKDVTNYASASVGAGTEGTPTATKGTVSNHSISVTPKVTNSAGYITGSTKTGTAVTVSASELVSGTYTVDSSGTKDVTNYANASVPAGTAGTPSASKGAVSNHSISVTPSVTNTTGWITGSTKTGTAVTVTASELASGNKAITQNGTGIDVVGYSTVSVDVQGSGSTTYRLDNIVPEQTITTSTTYSRAYGGAIQNYTETPQVGEMYLVTYDSTEYVCEGYRGDSTGYVIGEYRLFTSTTVNQYMSVPFACAYYNEDGFTLVTRDTNAHTIKVDKLTFIDDGETFTTKTITSNGTYNASSDSADGYSSVTVNVPTGTPTIQSLTVNPSTTQQTFNASGVDGYKPVTVSAVSQTNLTADNIKNGTTVTISNGTSNIYSVTGTYSGGGGGELIVAYSSATLATPSASISFTGLSGDPTSFVVLANADLATGAAPYKTAAVVFDGASLHGQTITNTNNAQVTYDGTNFTKSYSNGTLTITGTSYFQAATYYLTYTYGGGTIDTKDVQVGSGATSITFTGLEDQPSYWSCIFKSNFSTSSGYQRVIAVSNDGSTIMGLEMDSGSHIAQHWTASYNNGSLTITSQGTNQGGYFHQPGYYQLTYAYDDGSGGNYQNKTVTPTTSQQVIEADSGYDALKRVTVNAMPSGSATAPASISGTAASVSTGTNTLTLTKTISVTPTVSAGYVSTGTAGNSSVSLTASVTTKAAATITPTTTNQTIAAGTYLTGIQTIAGDADLVGGNILSTANIFGVQGTVVVQNYYTGSSAPSSSLGSNGDLYLQS